MGCGGREHLIAQNYPGLLDGLIPTAAFADTVVVMAGGRVVGYYALAAGAIDHAVATGKVRRNMPEPIPVMVLARVRLLRFQATRRGPRNRIAELLPTVRVARPHLAEPVLHDHDVIRADAVVFLDGEDPAVWWFAPEKSPLRRAIPTRVSAALAESPTRGRAAPAEQSLCRAPVSPCRRAPSE